MSDVYYRFFSTEFAGDKKLMKCAVNDYDHIGENFSSLGPWVGKIQKALNIWVRKQLLLPKERQPVPAVHVIPENNKFDRQTASLVESYKKRLKIFNRAGKIDPIVGKNTIHFLDKEFPGTPDPDAFHPPGVIFPPHKDLDDEDNPNLVLAGNHFKFKSLDQFSLGANVGVFSYAIAIWDIDNSRIAAYSYTGALAQISISPISDSGEGVWTNLITTAKFIQVDQFGGKAFHNAVTALINGMNITFAGSIIEHLRVDFPLSFSKSLLGGEAGVGFMSLVPDSVQIFKGP